MLRLLVVTPDMHRVHHSVDPEETNSNFGFNLPWWDRLFGTYRAQPREGHEGMTIGIEQFRDRRGPAPAPDAGATVHRPRERLRDHGMGRDREPGATDQGLRSGG